MGITFFVSEKPGDRETIHRGNISISMEIQENRDMSLRIS